MCPAHAHAQAHAAAARRMHKPAALEAALGNLGNGAVGASVPNLAGKLGRHFHQVCTQPRQAGGRGNHRSMQAFPLIQGSEKQGLVSDTIYQANSSTSMQCIACSAPASKALPTCFQRIPACQTLPQQAQHARRIQLAQVTQGRVRVLRPKSMWQQ